MCYYFQNSSLLLKLLSIKLVFSNQKKYTNPEVNNQQSLKTLKKYSQILSINLMYAAQKNVSNAK